MRPRARTSSLGSVARLHAFLLLVFCLRAGLCAEPDEELGRAKAIPVEHLKSIACEDRTTGIEFSPLGICFDLMGDLYVVDSDHSRIYLLDSTAERLTVFSECPSRYPGCELIDLAGNQIGGVYVSDRLTGSVLALDRWGELAAYAEAGEGVAGIAAGRAGKVFAALGIDGSIRIVDFDTETDGLISRVSYEDSDSYPVDCRWLGNGRLVITDAFSRQALILSELGELKGVATGFEFESPFGITCLDDRLIMVSDSDRGMVAAFDAAGGFLFAFGEGILDTPTFLDCRSDGVVCVSDVGSMTIEVFQVGSSSKE